MHKIILEEGKIEVIQFSEEARPLMKEVVKKEIIK